MNARLNRRSSRRERGAAAILAMMFLVIFASLAAAMAIVSQGNLQTADSSLKISRSLAASETGMRFMIYRINQVTVDVKTRAGEINATNAPALWDEIRAGLKASFANEVHNVDEPTEDGTTLTVGPIAVGPGEPTFTATLTPHPLAGEDYNSTYYQRAPYNAMTPAVSNASPLDATWVRVKVVASDGAAGKQISRSITMDFKLEKKIRYAILSRSRVMIGRNVMIEGPIGSRFTETNLTNGHPIQMRSDFVGLDSTLDASIQTFVNTLTVNDTNGDNRLNLSDPAESDGIANAEQYDTNSDGYIDDYDFFLDRFDTDGDEKVSNLELDTASNVNASQLMQLIDTFGLATRTGYNDGYIDDKDRYAKIRGEVKVLADMEGWNEGAAGGAYQNYFQGAIVAGHGEDPMTFQADDSSVHEFGPSDFDTSSFKAMATGDLATQAAAQAATYNASDPTSPKPLGTVATEAVPYGAAHPYDYYDRPVYENMTFTNVKIPKGSNALFKNCKFVGCTFVESTTDNGDEYFNYAGMRLADGTLKHPDKQATVGGVPVADTKTVANNVRFDGCAFEGAVVTDATPNYTHVRNKITFTGKTKFDTNAASLTDTQKALFRRSTILAPHYSVEMGTFVDANSANETVNLSGTIVAGVLDVRGQVKITGTILTTFEPESNTGPVLGTTSPQFNTTLGYFPSAQGDLEAELPSTGVGVVQIRYDKTIPMPDGILGPVDLTPEYGTYYEGGS
jgi:hypothetical protein